MISVFTQFLSEVWSLVTVCHCGWLLEETGKHGVGVSHWCFCLQLVLLYTLELFFILENKLYCYADESTLVAVVPSPDKRVTVAVLEL